MQRKPFLITPGDPKGIGAEITLKALGSQRLKKAGIPATFACIGSLEAFRPWTKSIEVITPSDLHSLPPQTKGSRSKIHLIAAPEKRPQEEPLPGSPWVRSLSTRFSQGGFQSGWSVELATRLVLDGKARGLITGPINKERLQAGGYPFSGHTDLLARLCGVRESTMMLANDKLRVSLVTVHIGLSQVSKTLSKKLILRALNHTHEALRRDFGLKNPKVAVLALNPHAGEGGLFGTEETRIIEPAIEDFRRSMGDNARISGPHPADTLFSKHILSRKQDRFDAVICMYHDQGLIPVKLLDFPKTVNVTLGLPIVRTSVDHGTAFDIAGRGIADPSSMIEAIRLAEKMTLKRSRPVGTKES